MKKMTIQKFEPVFASEGAADTDEVYAEYAGLGMVDERLRYKAFNKIVQTGQEKTNELIRLGVKTVGDAAADDVHTKNFFPNDFGRGADASNIFDLSSDELYNFVYCRTADNQRLLIGGCDGAIQGFNIETEASVGDIVSSAQLATGIPATMTAPDVYSVACDSEWVYALVVYEAVSEAVVQSFSISDGSVNPDWPAEGLAMSALAVSFNYFEARIRWVSETQLAVCQPWITVTSGTSSGIVVVDSADGTQLGSGVGDYPGSSARVIDVCGNGDYAFGLVQEAGQAYLCSMSLTSYGATGCGGTGWPGLTSVNHDDGDSGRIMCAGNTVVATFRVAPQLVMADVVRGPVLSSTSGDAGVVGSLGPIAFTGINWWALGSRTSYTQTVYKIKIGAYQNTAVASTAPIDEHVDVYCDYRDQNYDVATYYKNNLVFDGRDLWYYETDSDGGMFSFRRFFRANTR